jgi:8-oxo-dGTP pyrophosphatase MutT (NUDIX family)
MGDGEDSAQTVVREVREETNLEFKPIYFKSYMENFPHYGWVAEVDIFYGEFSGEVKINEEASDFGWFNLKEIRGMKIAYNHKEIIEDYFRFRHRDGGKN